MCFLDQLGLRATCITGKTEYSERDIIEEELFSSNTNIKFFYMTPEMAGRKSHFFKRMPISHVVIDEAHCVVDSIDFRPDFGTLREIRMNNKDVPFIALTTASPEIIDEIIVKLGMAGEEKVRIVRASSVRLNIFYEVIKLPEGGVFDFLRYIRRIDRDFEILRPETIPSGIIYCRTNDSVKEICGTLAELNIPATSYYGSLENRFDNYNLWMAHKVPIIVATSESFGCGVVKQDVKFVIHADLPKNLRAYYQVSMRGYFKSLYFKLFHISRKVEEQEGSVNKLILASFIERVFCHGPTLK